MATTFEIVDEILQVKTHAKYIVPLKPSCHFSTLLKASLEVACFQRPLEAF
jgi:hypothetical protein